MLNTSLAAYVWLTLDPAFQELQVLLRPRLNNASETSVRRSEIFSVACGFGEKEADTWRSDYCKPAM